MTERSDSIAITGLGMVASLGLDAVTSCATARAGLSNAAELLFQITDRETNELESVIGHSIPFVTTGFEGVGRLFRIAQLAFDDFKRSMHPSSIDPERCGCIVGLPSPDRSTKGTNEEEEGEEPYENRYLTIPPAYPDRDTLVGRIRQLAGVPFAEASPQFLHAGHATFVLAIEKAIDGIGSGEWDRCIVCAFDSLLEPHTLQWLFDHQRLKCDDIPVGLQPGEAGVVVLIEPESDAIDRDASILGKIAGVATAEDEAHFYTGDPPLGIGLANGIMRLDGVLDKGVQTDWLFCDLNGETRRAMDWGHALVRVSKEVPALASVTPVYPAASFGDTAVASGGISLGMSMRAFARDYAPASHALILSSSDCGQRGALCIQEPSANP